MSLKGMLGKALIRRIEALPAVQSAKEHGERIGPVLRAARTLAYLPLGDELAKNQLSEQLPADAALEEALASIAEREDYISDRVYRLLAAVAAQTTVEPIPSRNTDLFAEEESLGRLPLEQAFQHLAGIEPDLLGLRSRAQTARTQEGHERVLPKDLDQELKRLVGGAAQRENRLLRSDLASSIAQHYMRLLLGDAQYGPADMAFFENPRKTFSVTRVLLEPRRNNRPG